MIQGDVLAFLNVLGVREGDPRLEQVIAFVGGDVTTEIFDEDEGEATYLLMPESGVEFLLDGGELSSVFFHAQASAENAVYRGWSALIEGLDPAASPDEVRRALGAPIRSTEKYLLYRAGSGFVNLNFVGDALRMAVVMRRDIVGEAAVAGPGTPAS
ncbi:hypothetical protein ABMA10_14635 [Plantibacter sp. RU18]